ncbi:hypothetical protein [Streptomyces sp. NPDC006335]|uniref:hypothetical protein n=1 Tax=Streptomyces sp. NPDC006335 TaxID=3156895 RepID=UPI0033BB08DD
MPRPGQDLVPHTVAALVLRALAAPAAVRPPRTASERELNRRMLMVRALRQVGDGHPEEGTAEAVSGRVGHAHCRLCELADAVAFAVGRLADRTAGV